MCIGGMEVMMNIILVGENKNPAGAMRPGRADAEPFENYARTPGEGHRQQQFGVIRFM